MAMADLACVSHDMWFLALAFVFSFSIQAADTVQHLANFAELEYAASCWVCGSSKLTLDRMRTVADKPTPELFRVTDASYGQTFTIHRCGDCEFMQCNDASDVLGQYVDMSDTLYEATADARSRQMQSLMGAVREHKSSGRLLDVGAGIGLLIDEALKAGFDAEGVEPSRALQAAAVAKSLPVYQDVIPSRQIQGPYDVVTAIDVIEHVDNPLELLAAMRDVLAPDGIGVIVTPDVGSITARLMRRKWWHYRPAHIGYFNRDTIVRALSRAGLQPVVVTRPVWYLPVDYLLSRAANYLPGGKNIPVPNFLRSFGVPINLHDSLRVVFRKGVLNQSPSDIR